MSRPYKSRNAWQWARRFTRQLPQENKIQSTAGLSKQAESTVVQDLHIYCLSAQYPAEHSLVGSYCSCQHPFYSSNSMQCYSSSSRLCPEKLSFVIFHPKPMPTTTNRTGWWENCKTNSRYWTSLCQSLAALPNRGPAAYCTCMQRGDPTSLQASQLRSAIENCCWFQPIFGTEGFTTQPHLQADLEICLPQLLLAHGNNKAIFTWKAHPLFSQRHEQPSPQAREPGVSSRGGCLQAQRAI